MFENAFIGYVVIISYRGRGALFYVSVLKTICRKHMIEGLIHDLFHIIPASRADMANIEKGRY